MNYKKEGFNKLTSRRAYYLSSLIEHYDKIIYSDIDTIWKKDPRPYFKGSDGSNTILSNIDRTRTSFFEHRTNSNVFIYWWSNSNTLFLASNEQTSNIKPNRAFTKFTKLLIELTQTSFFRTSNELEHVHLLVIELWSWTIS